MKMEDKCYSALGYNDLMLSFDKYLYGDGLALSLFSRSEGQFETISVNLTDEQLTDKDCFFVDTNNCPWAESFLEVNGIAKPTGNLGFSGFCVYPEYRMVMDYAVS